MDNKVDVIFKLQERLSEKDIEISEKDIEISSLRWQQQQTLNLLEKYSITLMEYGIAILHE
jgi:hypothetical protein